MTAKARCALQNAVINWEDRLFPLVSDPHPRFSRSHSSKLPRNPCRLISLRFSIDRIAAYGGIVEANWATAGRAQVEDFRRRHRIGLVTLLFTDIIGSTELKQTLGDARAVTLIERHHSALRNYLPAIPKAKRSRRQETLSL